MLVYGGALSDSLSAGCGKNFGGSTAGYYLSAKDFLVVGSICCQGSVGNIGCNFPVQI